MTMSLYKLSMAMTVRYVQCVCVILIRLTVGTGSVRTASLDGLGRCNAQVYSATDNIRV